MRTALAASRECVYVVVVVGGGVQEGGKRQCDVVSGLCWDKLQADTACMPLLARLRCASIAAVAAVFFTQCGLKVGLAGWCHKNHWQCVYCGGCFKHAASSVGPRMEL